MRIKPIGLHAMARLPVVTSEFSDELTVSMLDVVKGGTTTITAPAHGLTLGQPAAICVARNRVPNAITEATVQPDGAVLLTLAHDHDLTQGYQTCVEIEGFTNSDLNGELALISVPNRTQIEVEPKAAIETISLNTNELINEEMSDQITGWHPVTVVDVNTLTFDTPAGVIRDYQQANPKIVKNIRVWGALDFENAHEAYFEFTKSDREAVNKKCYCFITPVATATLSKDRRAKSDATAEMTPSSFSQQLLLDGFNVYVFAPSDQKTGPVEAVDLCQGELLAAILKTFNGLSIQRPELLGSDHYVSWLVAHGGRYFDQAVYVHEYSFEAPVYITNDAGIKPHEITQIDLDNPAQSNAPIGESNFGSVVIDADGLKMTGLPQPLTASIKVNDE